MPVFNLYKEIQPTYGELLSLLDEMGYSKQIVDIKRPISKIHTKQYRLENPEHKSFILLPLLSDDTPVLKGFFAGYCIQLYWEGVTDDEQYMPKMIDKRRMAQKNQVSAQ